MREFTDAQLEVLRRFKRTEAKKNNPASDDEFFENIGTEHRESSPDPTLTKDNVNNESKSEAGFIL